MEIELASIEHPTDGQHHSGTPNIISKASRRQNTSTAKNIWDKHDASYYISRSRYSFFLIHKNINLIYIYYS